MLQSPLTDSHGFVSKKEQKELKKACQKTMDSLSKDIQQIELQIKNTIRNDSYLKELFELIEYVKGIGPVIATEILIVTNEFKDIADPKKLACHAGVVPFEHQSGKFKGRSKTSNKANKQLNGAARAGFTS